MAFQKASKRAAKLRLALIGPAGSGKTYTALNIGRHLGSRVALIDTEHGSASKYADLFAFDVMELETFHPQRYIDGIHEAEQAGYDVLILDSLSHAWMGKDGALELVDKAAKRSPSGNSFVAWRDVTPLHNQLVEAMLAAKLHLIVTMRSKMEYVQDKDEKGRTVIRKVGLQPIQRDGLEYEFDVVADLDMDNTLIVGKTRCSALAGQVLPKPGRDVAETLRAWLSDGAPMAEQKGQQGKPTPPSPSQAPTSERATAANPQPPQASAKAHHAEDRPAGEASKPAFEAYPTLIQLREMFDRAHSLGISDAELQRHIQTEYGKSSSKALTIDEYKQTLAWIGSRAVASEAELEPVDIPEHWDEAQDDPAQ